MSPLRHFTMDDEKRISLRLPTDLHDRPVERARTDRRPLGSEIAHLPEVTIGPVDGDDEPP
jgi:hypothetical protein